jgi:hypothetical protein
MNATAATTVTATMQTAVKILFGVAGFDKTILL